MSFFITVAPEECNLSNFGQKGLTPVRTDYECLLEVDFDKTRNRYFYNFDKPQYVLWHTDDTLTFKLVNKAQSQAEMWIMKHNCTEPGAVKLIDLANPTIEIAPALAYANKAQSISMKLQIQRHQLIHIGLIIEIEPNNGAMSEFLLCDPQVGSGPP